MDNERLGIRNQIINNNKEKWFVQHIQEHLDNHEMGNKARYITPMKVGCSICGLDIDQIAEDQMKEVEEIINKEFKSKKY